MTVKIAAHDNGSYGMSVPAQEIAIIGGGAAGFFAAIACAEANPQAKISILERGSECLAKVRISGGGRCNVTHSCFEPREFSLQYPRGERALISPFHRFSAADTIDWFQARGIKLKTEDDGRIFPCTDSSETIVDCLLESARSAGVRVFMRAGIERVEPTNDGQFRLFTGKRQIECDRLLISTGGCRAAGSVHLLQSLGHKVLAPVPSLFSLHCSAPWIRHLPGVSVGDIDASAPGTSLRERGPMIITHQGVSGPAILRLSAWGARVLHGVDYRFKLRINWLPQSSEEQLREWMKTQRISHPNRRVANDSPAGLPARLWEELTSGAGISEEIPWGRLKRGEANALLTSIARTEVEVTGKSLNKDEFVTCGGVDLREVDLRTMESRLRPGLFFAGEVLDIDGITGGFNFQAAWTTGWIAGKAMARANEETVKTRNPD